MFINIFRQKIIMFNFPDLCRLCLSSINLKFHLQSVDSENITLHAKLKWLEPNILEPDELLPSLICETCNEKLCQAYTFKEQCLQTREKLKSYAREILEVTSGQEVNEVKQEVDEHLDNSKPEANSDINDDTSDYICKTEIIDTNDSEYELPDSFSTSNRNNLTNNEKYQKVNSGFVNRFGAVRSENNRFEYTLHIGDSEKVVYISNYKEQIFGCTNCKKNYTNFSSLRKHLLVHSKEKYYKCDICGKETYTKSALNSHKVIHLEGRGSEICKDCGKLFKNKDRLRVHSQCHNKSCVCDTCGKLFSNVTILKKHIICAHSNKRDFICSICGFASKTPDYLKRHMSKHNTEKTFKCEVCKKLLKNRSTLNIHMKRHANNRKHVCHVCNKSFVVKGQYDVHFRIHSNEKPYLCNYCGKRFRRQDHYKTHVRIHTKEKNLMLVTLAVKLLHKNIA